MSTVALAVAFSFEPHRVAEFRDLARLADAAGARMVMTGDTPALLGDAYVGLSIIAAETARCRIGTFITNPVTRHPAVTTAAITTIDALSGGRALLGVGSGDSGVYNLGVPPASQARLEEFIGTLRALWDVGESMWDETRVRFTWSHTRVPIYLAAGGPRGLRLAGRIADGVIIENGLTPEVAAESLRHLSAGAADAGRSINDIDVWWHARAALAPNRDDAIDMIRSGLAGIANRAMRFGQEGKQIPPDLEHKFRALTAQYSLLHHEEHAGMYLRNAGLLDELGLRDYVADRWSIVGNVDDWGRRLEELEARGVRQIALALMMADKRAFLEQLADVVARAS
jgi:5,10-methylenetetrahydromethanopterin reductase